MMRSARSFIASSIFIISILCFLATRIPQSYGPILQQFHYEPKLSTELDAADDRPILAPSSSPATKATTSALSASSTPSPPINASPSSASTPPSSPIIPFTTTSTSSPSNPTPPILSPSDVVVLLKTGSSTVWRRLPLHLLTTFAHGRIPHHAIYSDAAERLAPGFATLDILANISTVLRTHDPAAHAVYTAQLAAAQRPNEYREAAGLPGDAATADGNTTATNDDGPGGWRLDRWKFLPMLAHAAHAWPAARWFVYLEDDTYLFWHNIRAWLAAQPDGEVAYHGAISGPAGRTFAQGGSGVAFSAALMREVFGAEDGPAGIMERFARVTAEGCCGDVVLGDVLREVGVRVNRGGFGTQLFRPEPPWKTRFDRAVWCEPVMTFHHLHQRDMAGLAELEEELKRGGPGEPSREKVLFRDVYMKFINPHLQDERKSGWDNYADVYVLTSNGILPDSLRESHIDSTRASGSAQGCQETCEQLATCLSWRWEHDSCALDTGIKFGRATTAREHGNVKVVSGWMLARFIEELRSNECWGFRD